MGARRFRIEQDKAPDKKISAWNGFGLETYAVVHFDDAVFHEWPFVRLARLNLLLRWVGSRCAGKARAIQSYEGQPNRALRSLSGLAASGALDRGAVLCGKA